MKFEGRDGVLLGKYPNYSENGYNGFVLNIVFPYSSSQLNINCFPRTCAIFMHFILGGAECLLTLARPKTFIPIKEYKQEKLLFFTFTGISRCLP